MISFSSVESLSVDDENVSSGESSVSESRSKDDGIELSSTPQSISSTMSSRNSSSDDVQVTPGEGEMKESVNLVGTKEDNSTV